MRARLHRQLLLSAIVLGSGAGLLAHERLRVGGDGNPLFWSDPTNVGIVINSTGSDDIADGSHETALRLAILDWNDVTGTDVLLVEDTDPAEQARTDWTANNIHLILFDEDNSSGYFGGGGIVAITPVFFFTSGVILDSDILFNGDGFSFTTDQTPGCFDVGDVGAHEIGHLLGLDHSGWAGATMYPYVDPTVILHRSLSLDEVAGLRDAYPQGAAFGDITGVIERLSDGSPVEGAHVTAVDPDGRTAGSILTRSNGSFTITGLDPSTYTVFADPLDQPVFSGNLVPGHTIETDFETTFYGGTALVLAGNTTNVGTLQVGADVALSLGSAIDNYPLRAIEGATTAHTVRGSGLIAGSTLTVSDTDLTLSSIVWFGTMVSFQVDVPGGETPGHVDLQVTNASGEVNVLPAALEITPMNPTVNSATPNVGPTAGGTFVTIDGTNFNPGARVVIGDQIYRDGEPGGCTVVNATTITLTTLATVGGVHDVVVLDSTGVEGRDAAGFTAAAVPVLNSIFPPSGDAAGGTEIVLRGADFVPGLVVRIDGVSQSTVTYDDPTRVRVTTDPGVAGGPYTVDVENPGGGIANGVFVYVAQADPTLTVTDPIKGTTKGGTLLTVTGADFDSDVTVLFGADPDTGLGGTAAASVTFVSATTLDVVTPAHAKGPVSVIVQDASTGQADVLAAGFSFKAPSAGGGGGCYTRPFTTPYGSRQILSGTWWVLLLLLITTRMKLRARTAPAV